MEIVRWIFISVVALGLIFASKQGAKIDDKGKVKIVIERADTTIYALPGDTIILQGNRYISLSPGDSLLIIRGNEIKKIIVKDSMEIRLLRTK